MVHLVNRMALAWFLVLFAGCGQMHDISVGETSNELNLGRCYGTGTDCGTRPPPTPLSSHSAQSQDRVPAEAPGLHVSWLRQVGAVPCAPLGTCSPTDIRVAGDGSVWTTATATAISADGTGADMGVFLGHYDQDGGVLAEKVINNTHTLGSAPPGIPPGQFPFAAGPLSLTLTTDSQARAVIGFGGLFRNFPPWLATYDASGSQVGKRIPLLGLDDVPVRLSLNHGRGGALMLLTYSMPPGPGYVMAGSDGTTIIADQVTLTELDSDLKRVWVQTNAVEPVDDNDRGGAPPLSVDVHGIVHVRAISWLAEVGPGRRLDWMQYDGKGNVIAVRRMDALPDSRTDWDAEGNLVLLRRKTGVSADTGLDLGKFGTGGEPIWMRHIATEPMTWHPNEQLPLAMDKDGTIYIARALVEGVNNIVTPVLYRLDANGENCTFARVDGVNGVLDWLFVREDGSLYFSANLGGPDATIGRLVP